MRWAGSKRKLLPFLKKNLPSSYNRYIEPFCGSACLFFDIPEVPAILSDINIDLINAFDQIKKDRNIREKLISIPSTPEEYYRIRAIKPDTLNSSDRAIRFLYLNRYCFNGVYRTNKKGDFNVPMGTRTGGFPSQIVFDEARDKLQKASVVNADYKVTIDRLECGDFVYMDPPYSKSSKFTGEYGVGSFDQRQIPEFIDVLDDLEKRGIKFLFSYRACSYTESKLKMNYNVENLSVKRHVSGFKNNWNDAKEILVKNYE